MFGQLIARATSRVVAGESFRHNEQWLNTASSYSANVGITILLLRPFPTFLRPLIAPFLPSVRQMKRQVRFAKDLFIPIINKRRAADAANDPDYVRPDDFLQWMMDRAADEKDRDPEALAHHMLILMSLAVVHTSSMALRHALYDVIYRPEYLSPLREEIARTLKDGWQNATKMSFDGQRRMDSFLRESQRFGPPGECECFRVSHLVGRSLLIYPVSFHRIVKEPLPLSDGLLLPKGTHICFPSGPMSKDAAFITDPNVFDGFRWCQDPTDRNALDGTTESASPANEGRASETQSNEKPRNRDLVPSTSTSFVSVSPANMHFGFGRQACPGRFFAASTIKAIMSRIIMDYDLKFEERQAGRRPRNIVVGEHIFPSTSTTVLFRKREISSCE